MDSKATYPHLIHALNTMRTSRTRITQRIHAQSACTMCLPVSYTCMHVHGSAKCRFAIKSVRGVSRQDSKPIRIENHVDFEESEKSRDSWRAEKTACRAEKGRISGADTCRKSYYLSSHLRARG